MDQRDKQELISAYWDGELSGPERTEVESLLESSPEFRRDLDDYARLSDLLRALPNESAPVELAAAVRRQAEEQLLLVPAAAVSKRSLRREWISAGVGMAVTAAGMLVAVQMMDRPAAQNAGISADRSAGGSMTVATAEAPSDSREFRHTPLRSTGSEMVAAKDEPVAGSAVSEPALPASKLDAAATSEALPPAMLGLSSNELFDNEGVLNGVRIGNVLQYIEQRGDSVAVVELQVVDVTQSLGQLEVLLKEQQVDVLPSGVVRRSDVSTENQPPVPVLGDGQLTTVFLEASTDQVDQLFGEMSRRKLFVQASLQPPVDVPANAAPEQADSKSADEQAQLKRHSEELVRGEADEAARQYLSRNRAAQNAPGFQESKLSEEMKTANRSGKRSRSTADDSRISKAAPSSEQATSRKQAGVGQKAQTRLGLDVAPPQQNLAFIQQQAVSKENGLATEPAQDAPSDADSDVPERTVRMLMVLIPQQMPAAAGPQQ